jgi:ELWxxDGT repeat protein
VGYFVAGTPTTGAELWKTDGTSAGTSMVRDIRPGSESSGIKFLTNVNGTLFFGATDGANGYELWKSDGTAAGTVMVQNIHPTAGSNPSSLRNVGGVLYFSADDGVNGYELWRSNGTAAGTTLVRNIRTGVAGSQPESLTEMGGVLYFTANDGTNGVEMWRSDGTTAGTTLIRNIRAGTASAFPTGLVNVGGVLYFAANNGTNGTELWRSNGTSIGTTLVRDMAVGAFGSYPAELVNVGGTLYFRASNNVNGFELWKSNGTFNGTVMVKDIEPGGGGSNPTSLTNVNGVLYFTAYELAAGVELWKSDGTSLGTVEVAELQAGDFGSYPTELANVGGTLYFSASDGVKGAELWRSNGTVAGTTLVKDIATSAGSGSYPQNLFSLNGTLLFTANDGVSGSEVWVSNGTAAGTTLLKDIVTSTKDSLVANTTVVGSNVFFTADNGVSGVELWVTNGTTAGTRLVADIASGVLSSTPSNLTNVNGTLYFSADDGASGVELWKTDGTAAGTVMVSDLNVGGYSSLPANLVNIGGVLYFAADNGTDGLELWKSDGTTAGTVLVKDIQVGAFGSYPSQLTNVNGTLFFSAYDGVNGVELWKSDGTDIGTVMVKDIRPGTTAASSNPSSLVNVGGVLYFAAGDSVEGTELWKSDGTLAGTQLVSGIVAGAVGAYPTQLTNVAGTLYFAADNGTTGVELWKSDGTAIGTQLVRDIRTGLESSGVTGLTAVGSTVYFQATDGVNGAELWKSDGTTAGTVLVKDAWAGASGSSPAGITEVAGKVYFSSDNGVQGRELWVSDGTNAGTVRAASLTATVLGIDPLGITNVNGQVYFSAVTATSGRELWRELVAGNAPTNIALSSSIVAENAGANAVVGALSTTDPDVGDTFVYSLVAGVGGADNAAFNIAGNSLRATTSLNFEAKASYSVRVRSTDQTGLFTEKEFVVSVTDVNEAPIDIAISASTIAENAGVNAAVGSLSTTDADAGNTFTYTLVAGAGDTDNAAFSISAGALVANSSFDFETKSSYTVRVRTTDQGGLFVEKAFVISVTNVNEAPTDIAISASSLAENSGANATVGALATSDVDAGNTFTYTLVAGTGDADNAAFNISGALLRATSSLDFETKSSYTVRVRSTDQGGLVTEKSFIISVTNVNETPTDIGLSSTSIPENSGANATVGTLSTVDVDAGNTFVYSLVAGTGSTDNAAFNISGTALRATSNLLAASQGSYSVRVRSTDQGGLFTEKVFTITVTAGNGAPTDIALPTPFIFENAGVNATVGSLSTTDPNATDTFTYTLVAGLGDADNAAFNVNGVTLRASNSFDYETRSSYSVRLRSTDQGGLFTEKVFIISVINTNEAPTDVVLSSNQIAELSAANTTVGLLSTVDADAANSFAYNLVAGAGDTDNAVFNISGNALRATNTLDFESKPTYTVRVRTTDQGGLFTEKAFVINVTNVNENPTDIALSSATIAENAGANATVGSLSTTDVDAGDTFTYTLVAGTGDTDNASFNLNGSALRATSSLDFETKSSYTVRVRSTDQGGLFTEKAFVITVTNANEAPTDITLSSSVIAENSGANATVGTLSSTDPDAGSTFTYTLVAGAGDTDNAAFNINAGSLRATSNLDFENKSSYTVRVRSTDQGGLFTEKVFVISVSDINEVPTDLGISSTSIPENAGANATIGTLGTTDPDAGNTFTYSLVAGTGDADNAAFNLSGNVLRATSSLDFEAKSSYTVRVRSTDQGGLFTEKAFVISVTDVNESPTDLAISSTSIPENSGANATVGTLSSTDPDAGNTFTYSLVAGTGDVDNAAFNISGNALRATNNLVFATRSSYTVRVRTTDQGGLFTERSFLINVTSGNTAPSDIALSSSSIAENLGANATVGALSTTDNNASDTFTYSLVAGTGDTDNAAFNISGNALRATNSLDFETKSSYTVRVRSTDQGGLFTEKAFVITVIDMPEDTPVSGTAAADAFVANYTGDGVTGQWLVTRNGTVVFSGVVPNGGALVFDGLAGADSLLINGSALDDTFTLDGQTIVTNGSRIRTVNVESMRITAGNGNDALTVMSGAVAFDGGLGSDRLATATGTNTFSVTGVGIGTLNTVVSFTALESLQGGTGADSFVLGASGRLTGLVIGGDGVDTVNLAAKTTAHTANLLTNTLTSTGGIAGIESFVGGVSTADVLIGANVPNAWNITGQNAGTLNATTSFSGFESLTGGTDVDSFVFGSAGQVTGTLNAGTGADVANFAAVTTPLQVQLGATAAISGLVGRYTALERIEGNSVAGGQILGTNAITAWVVNTAGEVVVSGGTYAGIPAIVGGTLADTITGPAVSTRWTLSGANAGSVGVGTTSVAFTGVENLTGSTASDEFIISPTGTLSGNLNGGTGTGINSVDYSAWSAAVLVNLGITTAGNASAVTGAMTSIAMVTGGAGNDTLTGRATLSTILIGLGGDDVLTGGSQRDLLFGGTGADILQGVGGDDLLIAGTTSFDRDRAALLLIHSEWISTRTFAQRTANIWGNGTGTRANVNTFLNSGLADGITDSVFADADNDILIGGIGGTNQDWFFANLLEVNDLVTTGATPDRRDTPA